MTNGLGNYKLSTDSIVTNSDHKLKYTISVYTVSYENSPWKYVFISMLAYFLQPIIMPTIILFSKLLKRKIEFFPININNE
jgi:hypothetical protein